jgi:hypothetical protein
MGVSNAYPLNEIVKLHTFGAENHVERNDGGGEE